MPAGRPSKYRDEYCEQVIEVCAQGFSLTGFAGKIGVGRDTITEWCRAHPEFSSAVKRAKAATAAWWEEKARKVGEEGGSGGQSTMVIFGLKNHAREDYSDTTRHEHSGPNGGPIPLSIEERKRKVDALLSAAEPEE